MLTCAGECSVKDEFIPDSSVPDDIKPLYEHPIIGYNILTEFAGRGPATAAANALVDYCREHLDDKWIAAVGKHAQCRVNRADVPEGALSENKASTAILTKLGFRSVFHHVQTYDRPWGEWLLDAHWYMLRLRGAS